MKSSGIDWWTWTHMIAFSFKKNKDNETKKALLKPKLNKEKQEKRV